MDDSCPPEGNPENRINNISTVCSYGMRPHVVTGLLRQLLTAHFADTDNIAEPQLRRKFEQIGPWRQDDNGTGNSGISIESITRWNPSAADKRPALIIKRNGWQWSSLGIGDKSGSNIFEGSTSYTGLWEGSHTIYCLAATGVETELLAIETVKFLTHFSPWIREQMNFKRFIISEVGGIGEVQEVVQGYAVPVTVAYVAEESWSLQLDAPRLKRITLKASDLFSC